MNINSNVINTEFLESINDLKSSLVALSISPVKADNRAIARLEIKSGREISNIINNLEDLEIMARTLGKNDLSQDMISKSITAIIRGILFGAIASLTFLIIKPEITRPAFCLSFVIGITSSCLSKVEG
ncbi:hypothetical protein [Dolichospermum circinale]|uniref:hypothetical protein n=1 Tax=Dolichospermum circinale TaxID=109265 RepID=UPI002330E17D|nr:hypothetical protein [Dolichospermum circinale]MDB9454653.1 hypothetical protein [Dolichospermum circinale CS-541/06]MDB9461444.1 hypothetical protein [Dolichospermum circinale CS-541/04]MDB9546455.1 hypothetical protein [Dolichospermum circinale CS-1031]